MAKRMIIMLAVFLGFVGVIGFVKYRQIRAGIEGGGYTPPPEAVTTVVAQEAHWEGTMHAIGTVTAVQGVTVSADLPGIVAEIAFESGRRVRAGDVLVRLDTSQERAQLAAAEARRDLAQLNLKRVGELREKNATSQADLDRVAAEAKQADAAVAELEAVIQRKTIRAPFSGILGLRQVNLGQYLAGGDPVVPLQALAPIYVNFNLPQQDAERLVPGVEVRVVSEHGADVVATGRISAVNSIIDPATRNVEAQASFANADGKLRPGMFVELDVMTQTNSTVVALPASAISFAPYGDSVFIVEEMKGPDGQPYKGVRQQFVKLGATRGDQVAILTGVTAGQEVVSSGVFKLRTGASVQVNNEVQPANSLEPKPKDS
jgi:membrane fusion protein (multidrug efflux system)